MNRRQLLASTIAAAVAPALPAQAATAYWYDVTFSSQGENWETSQTCFAHGPTRAVFNWATTKRDEYGAHAVKVTAIPEAPAQMWRHYCVSL